MQETHPQTGKTRQKPLPKWAFWGLLATLSVIILTAPAVVIRTNGISDYRSAIARAQSSELIYSLECIRALTPECTEDIRSSWPKLCAGTWGDQHDIIELEEIIEDHANRTFILTVQQPPQSLIAELETDQGRTAAIIDFIEVHDLHLSIHFFNDPRDWSTPGTIPNELQPYTNPTTFRSWAYFLFAQSLASEDPAEDLRSLDILNAHSKPQSTLLLYMFSLVTSSIRDKAYLTHIRRGSLTEELAQEWLKEKPEFLTHAAKAIAAERVMMITPRQKSIIAGDYQKFGHGSRSDYWASEGNWLHQSWAWLHYPKDCAVVVDHLVDAELWCLDRGGSIERHRALLDRLHGERASDHLLNTESCLATACNAEAWHRGWRLAGRLLLDLHADISLPDSQAELETRFPGSLAGNKRRPDFTYTKTGPRDFQLGIDFSATDPIVRGFNRSQLIFDTQKAGLYE